MLHYQYVDGTTWLEFDRFEIVPPGVPLTVLTDFHNPESEFGTLLVTAVRGFVDAGGGSFNDPIDFDHLVGSAVLVDAKLDHLVSYVPYGFAAVVDSADPCFPESADDDQDGAADFDGIEFPKFPRELILESYFEERGTVANSIALFSTAGRDFISEIELAFWNNDETLFLSTDEFNSFSLSSLSDLSPVVSDLGGDPEEFGPPTFETGWAKVRGRRIVDLAGNPVLDRQGGHAIPPLVGVFLQTLGDSDLTTGHTLQHRGELDGLELIQGNQDAQDNGEGSHAN